jgi:flotillin
MLKSVPPLEDVFKTAGMELPKYLKGTVNKEKSIELQELKETSTKC